MLETLDLKRSVGKASYRRIFPRLQEALRGLQYELQRAEIATVVVFEGVDAAGKGTTISRLVERLDPRLYRVVPAAPPTPEERGRHFLWRHQSKLPADGHMTVYDRSWYGRVLVERIDGGLPEDQVRRAYTEIRDFERWLCDDGQVVVKFWLHIGRRMQKRRLKRLEKDPLLSWKVTPEDWEHHHAYGAWIEAAEQAFTATDTPCAPWTLVAAGDKRALRIEVFRTLIRRMQDALARRLSSPESVSRTAAGEVHLRKARERTAADLSSQARAEAEAAGLPLEEAPEPPRLGARGRKRRAGDAAKRRSASRRGRRPRRGAGGPARKGRR